MTQEGHEDAQRRADLAERYAKLAAAGKARPMPACFDDEKVWREYQVLSNAADAKAEPVPCRDCTPEYQAKHIAARTCAHPEAVFVCNKSGGDIEGITADDYTLWRDVCIGHTTKKVLRIPSIGERLAVEVRRAKK